LLRAAALLIPSLVLFPFLGSGGIWDPHELDVADFARRIAVNLFGVQSLSIMDMDNAMPTIEQLGKGELPFTSIAAGFAAFGLHEWAGRLPLALWALAGVAAVYWLVTRLMDERAGAFASIVLSTMPLFFVQARTMLGDIVTFSSVTMAIAGLGVLAFDDRSGFKSRIGSSVLAVVGLCGGLMSRGMLVGVALPLLTVGLGWAVSSLSSSGTRGSRWSLSVGLACLVLGATAASWTSYLLFTVQGDHGVRWLGSVVAKQAQPPAFDRTILILGHALFPWSAFIPFALGRLFRPGVLLADDQAIRERGLRVLIVVGSCLSLGVAGLMSPYTKGIPFAGVALLAALAAVVIRDLERGAHASRTLALGTVTFLLLFFRDFRMWPEKALSAFMVDASSFPDSFKQSASSWMIACVVVSGVLVFASWIERDTPGAKSFVLSEYLGVVKTLYGAADGRLRLVGLVVECVLTITAITVFVGLKTQWRPVLSMSSTVRMLAINGWLIAPLSLGAIIVAALAFRDACRWVFPRLRISRATAALAAGAVSGVLLSTSYYPALASQLSPKEVFDAYARKRSGDEPLGLLGVNGRTASFYAGSPAEAFSNVDLAIRWLLDGDQRKWMVIRDQDLARMNSTFRSQTRSGLNLPILDSRSSQILLASNQLLDRETNHNPLDAVLLHTRPTPSRPLDIEMQDQLKALGWDIVDTDGVVVDSVVTARTYRIRLYYEVIGRVSRDWECFIHIDGYGRRYNGDHPPLDKKYSMTLWQVGDFVVDDYPFQLEPNFTPGNYSLYYGFFVGSTRLKVSKGKHHEDRIEGGTIQVR